MSSRVSHRLNYQFSRFALYGTSPSILTDSSILQNIALATLGQTHIDTIFGFDLHKAKHLIYHTYISNSYVLRACNGEWPHAEVLNFFNFCSFNVH